MIFVEELQRSIVVKEVWIRGEVISEEYMYYCDAGENEEAKGGKDMVAFEVGALDKRKPCWMNRRWPPNEKEAPMKAADVMPFATQLQIASISRSCGSSHVECTRQSNSSIPAYTLIFIAIDGCGSYPSTTKSSLTKSSIFSTCLFHLNFGNSLGSLFNCTSKAST